MTELSIVVPALNEARALPVLLADLAAWRERGDEVIVVDGGSTDGTPDVAATGCDRVLQSARGRAPQMNAGAGAARGRVLWFVHADTRVDAVAREVLLSAAARERAWGRFDVRIDDRAPAFRVIETLMNLRSRLTGIATGDQGVFATRSLFEAVGGFPAIALMEDVAFSRALRAHARPRCLPKLIATSSRRWRTRGIARTVLAMWSLRLAYALGAPPDRLARLYGDR